MGSRGPGLHGPAGNGRQPRQQCACALRIMCSVWNSRQPRQQCACALHIMCSVWDSRQPRQSIVREGPAYLVQRVGQQPQQVCLLLGRHWATTGTYHKLGLCTLKQLQQMCLA